MILSKELDTCQQERDQYKLMANQLRERHQALKKKYRELIVSSAFNEEQKSLQSFFVVLKRLEMSCFCLFDQQDGDLSLPPEKRNQVSHQIVEEKHVFLSRHWGVFLFLFFLNTKYVKAEILFTFFNL